MPFAWSSTKPSRSSTKACRRPGTPEVAPRTNHASSPNATTPSRMDVTTVSRCSVQKDPSPSDTVRGVWWCAMYELGVSSAAMGSEVLFVVAHGDRGAEDHDGHGKGPEKRKGDDFF